MPRSSADCSYQYFREVHEPAQMHKANCVNNSFQGTSILKNTNCISMQSTPPLVHCIQNLQLGMVFFKLILALNKEKNILNSVSFGISLSQPGHLFPSFLSTSFSTPFSGILIYQTFVTRKSAKFSQPTLVYDSQNLT